jgi:hypothetical protein
VYKLSKDKQPNEKLLPTVCEISDFGIVKILKQKKKSVDLVFPHLLYGINHGAVQNRKNCNRMKSNNKKRK